MNRSIAIGIPAVVAFLLAALFVVQNMGRKTQLSIDLGVAAFQLPQPVEVPVLMGVCVLAGLLLGVAALLPGRMAASKKAQRLEQQLAYAGDGSDDGWSA